MNARLVLAAVGLCLSAGLWVGCQDNASTATPAKDESVSTSQSAQPSTGSGACGKPGPISSGYGTPRCNMYVTQPVCGCNGKTYQNDCLAWTDDVNVAYKGECKGLVK